MKHFNIDHVAEAGAALLLVGFGAHELVDSPNRHQGINTQPIQEYADEDTEHLGVHGQIRNILATLTPESRAACEQYLDTSLLEKIHADAPKAMHQAMLKVRLGMMQQMQNTNQLTPEDQQVLDALAKAIEVQTDMSSEYKGEVLLAVHGVPWTQDYCRKSLEATRVATTLDFQS